tara:strand:- start:230 stop:577 length:348 start_codon:yes stop_codon:yes gene_type:complete
MRYRISELRRIIRKVLIEAVDQNKDGKNDFDDVKIARMKASGMSKKEIEKEDPSLYEAEYEYDDVDDAEDEDLLVEPDLSAEDDREMDEFSTVAGGAIRGYQAPLGYDRKKMKGY